MIDDKKKKLDDLIQRRDALQGKVARVQGRLDSARKDLKTVEDDCRKKKLDPADLEATITKLETKLTNETNALDISIRKAEGSITPFLED